MTRQKSRKEYILERLLNDNIAQQVREVFDNLESPVVVLSFGREGDQHSEISQQLIGEVVELSDKLSLETYDFDNDKETADKYHVTESPALVLASKDGDEIVDHGVRVLGTPSGHEFTSLIHGLISVSQKESPLSEATKAYLKALDKPVRFKVFSTPG